MNGRPAVFLDRDGVIVEEVNYLADPRQVRLIPGAAEAIAKLNRAGWPVVVVTNQAGVARGYFPESRIAEVHDHLSKLLAGHGARIDRYYYCPHHPTEGVGPYRVACQCRKPHAGMLLQAAVDLGLNPARSWTVGDKVSDLQAGAWVGAKTVLVRTGYGRTVDESTLDRRRLNLVRVAADLADAVDSCILAQGLARAA
jgi:D-glycero-D-manno-heptose 1,7-bisphosphate phosphatase